MLINVDLSDSSVVIPKTEIKEMISVTKVGDKTKVKINSSSLGVIQECKRKSKYLLLDGWKMDTEAPATVFGSAIHKAMEVFYSGEIADRKLPKLEDMELMSYGHKVRGEDSDLVLRATRAFIERAVQLQPLPETDKRSIQNGVWILWYYFSAFIDDGYKAYVDENGPFVERQFTFTLYEDANLIVEYFGQIDFVLQNIKTGDLIPGDHKTSSMVGADFFNRLKPNHQYTGYLMGAKEVFKLDTDKFMVNCIEVKAKPKTKAGKPPNFPRQITTRDKNDFAEFKDSVVQAVREYLYARETGLWPIGHVNACAMYGGCSYLSVCSAPDSLRENVLKSKFIQGK